MQKFEKSYWDKYYAKPEDMDGIGNVSLHVNYLHALLELDEFKVKSILDVGFGKGVLFKSCIKKFKPYRAEGIEVSKYIYDQVSFKKYQQLTKLKTSNESVVKWCKNKSSKKFDLAIMTSVAQYLSDAELSLVMKELSLRVKVLYFTAPTNKELDRQINEYDFKDEQAIRRSKTKYKNIISPHFRIISNRLLESKHYFSETNSSFSEMLYKTW